MTKTLCVVIHSGGSYSDQWQTELCVTNNDKAIELCESCNQIINNLNEKSLLLYKEFEKDVANLGYGQDFTTIRNDMYKKRDAIEKEALILIQQIFPEVSSYNIVDSCFVYSEVPYYE